MKDGFIKVAAAVPEIRVADCIFNAQSICAQMDEAAREHVKILVFPELCVTGYTCGDLFWQEKLLCAARQALCTLVEHSAGRDTLTFVGLPWEKEGKLYNVAAAFSDGELLGLVPKRHLPNYNEFYEARHFTPGSREVSCVDFGGKLVPFGMNLLFASEKSDLPWRSGGSVNGSLGNDSGSSFDAGSLCVAAELCEDLWTANPPSTAHALAGANVIVNLSASDEVVGKRQYRSSLVSGQSARLLCGYIYASAGEGESTQDVVYGGHCLIAENGHILAESERFYGGNAESGHALAGTESNQSENAKNEHSPVGSEQIFDSHAENGHMPVESEAAGDKKTVSGAEDSLCCGITYAELDISRLRAERRRMTTFGAEQDQESRVTTIRSAGTPLQNACYSDNASMLRQGGSLDGRSALDSFMGDNFYCSSGIQGGYTKVCFQLKEEKTALTRTFSPAPFVPSDEKNRSDRCEEILTIQALGLKKRMKHTNSKSLVVGISGGLDSTLALLVMTKACDLLRLPRETMIAVTMPGFGTTGRTYRNACDLTRSLGAQLLEVDIRDAVNIHFRDIGQDPEVHDVTYENCQARERTQILMDIANKTGGMVIGTGDMSELALGWATYNGDHMSMYGVNCSVPKTLVRHLVRYYADTCGDERVSAILYDVLDTPVSPELLPPQDGEISQKTEDIVGPYELHDFFLYYMLRFGFPPAKIFRIAKQSFADVYDEATILKWLKTFYRRFFAQQFKRSCVPDGPKVGSVALSPRGDLRMPSDACVRLWMEEMERL
ncbi:MAG: NAD(+) synthase [Lachnospiraceae bacterium]|nr:NAD(+) synthase [Lachnospiraceae bacterium]